MFIFDAHLDLAMNALEWNRDFSRPIEEIRPREARHDRSARPRPGHGLVRRDAARAHRPVRGHADRAVRASRQPAAGLALAGAGVGDDAGAARLVPRDGARGELVQVRDAAGLDRHLRRWQRQTTSTRAPVGYILSLEGADSIVSMRHLERAVRGRSARDRPGALRARAPTRRAPTPTAASARAGASSCARWSGSASSSTRRTSATQLLGGARRVPRAGLGEPLQLPRARAAQPAVQRRSDPRARGPRRRHRRRARCLDDRARLGARQEHARDARASRSIG